MMNDALPILIFLCSVFAPFAETGVPSQPIKAVEGDDVTLRCPLTPGVNLSPYTVDVTRLDLDANDNVVHVYRGGKDHLPPQMAQYKGRTTLIHKDLIRGILTLMISPVKMSDSGRYCCFAPHLTTSRVIDLTVAPKGDSSTTRPPVEGVTKSDDHGQQVGSKRNDSSTTPPVEEVTKSDGRDGENRRSFGAGIVSAAVVILCIFIALILNGKKIQNCERTIRARREQEAKVTNGTELSPLRA